MSRAILYATSLLANKRTERGWTQAEFADVLSLASGEEVSLSAVQKWEIKDRTIPAALALEAAKLLNVQVRELVEQKNL